MDGGDKLTEGAPKNVIGKYQKLLYAPAEKAKDIRAAVSAEGDVTLSTLNSIVESVQHTSSKNAIDEIFEFYDPHLKTQSELSYEPQGATIQFPQIVNLAGESVNCLIRGRTYRYTYKVNFTLAAMSVRFGMMIKTLTGVELGGAATAMSPLDTISYVAPGTIIQVEFAFECNLNPGTYFLNAGVLGAVGEEETYLHRLLDACLFRVLPMTEQLATGVVDFKCVPDVLIFSGENI